MNRRSWLDTRAHSALSQRERLAQVAQHLELVKQNASLERVTVVEVRNDFHMSITTSRIPVGFRGPSQIKN